MNRQRWRLLLTLGIGIGIGMALRELDRGPPPGAAAAEKHYRVLQDRDLYGEAAASRKEELEEKLEKLASQGWELLNPSAAYIEDKGFVVTMGDLSQDAEYPDRRAVILGPVRGLDCIAYAWVRVRMPIDRQAHRRTAGFSA